MPKPFCDIHLSKVTSHEVIEVTLHEVAVVILFSQETTVVICVSGTMLSKGLIGNDSAVLISMGRV